MFDGLSSDVGGFRLVNYAWGFRNTPCGVSL